MDITYKLEEPFTYSWSLVLIIIIVMIILVFFYVLILIKPFFYKKIVGVVSEAMLPSLKARYIKKLEKLMSLVESGRINNRDAYTKLSVIIREFIKHASGINVLSLSKEEIKKMNMKELSLLMEEYYPPEFAKNINGDINESIKRTIEVIQKWN